MKRCDCVIGAGDHIYVMEYKMDKSAAEAMNQINEKGYAERYHSDQREVIKIGVSFSSDRHHFEEWIIA